MISPQDILHLPWDESLSLAGVTYVRQNLGRILGGPRPPSPPALRQLVASIAAELAFRRWLDSEQIPYTLLDDEPFTRPEWPRLTLGGRRLSLHTRLVSSRRAIQSIRRNPSVLMDAPAAVAPSALEAGGLSEGDLLAFGLLLGLETRSLTDLERALAAGRPLYLVALPPGRWSRRDDLGIVTLSSPSGRQEVVVEGQLPSRAPWSIRTTLDPSAPMQSPPLHALIALHALGRPAGPVLVSTSAHPSPWQINPGMWCNLWVYGVELLALGWRTVRAFRAASRQHVGRRHSFLGIRAPEAWPTIEARHLRPLLALADRLRQP